LVAGGGYFFNFNTGTSKNTVAREVIDNLNGRGYFVILVSGMIIFY